MLDLGTLSAKIKLDGADAFKKDLKDVASESTATQNKLSSAFRVAKEASQIARRGIEQVGKALKPIGDLAKKACSIAVNALKKLGQTAIDVGQKIAHALSTAFKVGITATTAALVALSKTAISTYADTQQLVGGVETLFKDDAGRLLENAETAYLRAGMSANEYMENAVQFSASLVSSLGGDTEKAVDLVDLAITDMSDNANKMGTNISSIENAYQGFAKGTFTMLDNLRLGYGGTKEEMERLLADAEKLSGQKYDINNLSDIIQAIHIIQQELGITGTTGEEALHTISGSINTLKAGWKDFVSGLANPDADMAELAGKVKVGIDAVLDNILPAIDQLSVSIPEAIKNFDEMKLVEDIRHKIKPVFARFAQMATEEAPVIMASFLSLGMSAIYSIGMGITRGLPQAQKNIHDAVPRLVRQALTGLRNITKEAVKVLPDAIEEFRTGFPEMIDKICSTIDTEGPRIIENMKTILSGVFNLENYEIAWEGITDVVSSLADAFDTAGVDWTVVGDKIGEAINWALENIVPSALDGLAGLLSVAERVIDGIAKQIDTLETGENSPLVSAIKEFIPKALNSITEITADLTTIATAIIKAIASSLGLNTDGLDQMKQGLNTFFEKIQQGDLEGAGKAIGEAVVGAIDFATDALGTILNKVFTFQNVASALDGIAGFFNILGKGIIDKIVEIVSNPAEGARILGALAQAIAGAPLAMASGIVDAILDKVLGEDYEKPNEQVEVEADKVEAEGGDYSRGESLTEGQYRKEVDYNQQINELITDRKAEVQDLGQGMFQVLDISNGQVLAIQNAESGMWGLTEAGEQYLYGLQQSNEETEKNSEKVEEAGEKYEEVKDNAEEALDKTKDITTEADNASDELEGMSENAQAVADALSSPEGQTILTGIMTEILSSTEKIGEMKTTIGETISSWDFAAEGETVGKNIIESIKSGVKQDQLVPKGKQVMTSLKKGITDGFNSKVKPELAKTGQNCFQAVGDLSNTLHSKGQDLMMGFIRGVQSMQSAVNASVQSIVNSIKISNTNMLYLSGQQIIQGLIDGMNSKKSALEALLNSYNALIKNKKGPPEYDKVMLYPSGQYIMDGLINGIASSEKKLYGKLDTITNRISSTRFKNVQLAYAGASSSSTSGNTTNIYINGTRINDDPQIRSQFETLIKDMARKGMM